MNDLTELIEGFESVEQTLKRIGANCERVLINRNPDGSLEIQLTAMRNGLRFHGVGNDPLGQVKGQIFDARA